MPHRTIMITGASSGLGAALAQHYAKPGVTLHLSARNADRLADVATRCRAAGATVQPQILDVRDRAAMEDWIGGLGSLDVVIANAGVSAGTMGQEIEADDQIRAIFGINVDGVLNTVLPAMRQMKTQPPDQTGIKGRVAVVASVAAFVAAPGAPSYCAAKAAVDRWATATAPSARKQGITITSLCPGYIRTPMTDQNRFPMPGMMEPADIARRMADAIDRGAPRLTRPLWLATVAKLTSLLPLSIANALMQRSAGKDADSRL